MVLPQLGLTPAVVAAVCHGLLISSVTSELVWLRLSGRLANLHEARVALGMAAGAALVGIAYTAALSWIWVRLATHAPAALAAAWTGRPLLALLVAFVCWDAAGWVYHRVGHRTAVGWAAHRPHHTGTEYNLALALRQSWLPWHGLLVHPALALAGFPFETIVICSLISNLWQAWTHSAAPVTAPRWVEAILVTPTTHRLHHRIDGGGVNLGPVLTLWDRLAGTWVPAAAPGHVRYGVDGSPSPGLLAAELDGWSALLRRPRTRASA